MNQKRGKRGRESRSQQASSSPALRQRVPPQAPFQTQGLIAALKEHPVFAVLSTILALLVAIATIGPATGYALEKWQDTTATIDFLGEIDQKKPFTIPLVIKNPSAIFSIHVPKISCWIDVEYLNAKGDHRAIVAADQPPTSGGLAIEPLRTRNYFCNAPDNLAVHEGPSPDGPLIPIKQANMLVKLDYETWIPWSISRQVVQQFIMLQTPAGLRWIKGQWIAPTQETVWPPGTQPPWIGDKPKLN